MANWAYTSYAIEGNRESLEKIYEAILHPDVKEGSTEGWEGNVLRALGIEWEEAKPGGEGKHIRGFISDEPWWGDDEHTFLRFEAEEAWNVTDFDCILMENLKDVKVYWTTEEEGMGIYVTNDKKGKYFPYRFFVDTCINDNYSNDYFKDKDSAYKWLSKITDGKIKTTEDAKAFNEKHDEEGDDDFIYVHEYKVIDNETEVLPD